MRVKYRITMLIMIIISLGQILLSHFANTSCTHARMHTLAHTHPPPSPFRLSLFDGSVAPNHGGVNAPFRRFRWQSMAACTHSHTPTHRRRRSGCRCSMGRWRPTMTELTPLFAGSAGNQWPHAHTRTHPPTAVAVQVVAVRWVGGAQPWRS